MAMGYVLRWKVAQHEMGTAARWEMEDNPVRPNVESFRHILAPASLGLVVNEAGRHWTAVRWEHGRYWLLDSLRDTPIPMTQPEAIRYIRRYERAFLIVDNVYV